MIYIAGLNLEYDNISKILNLLNIEYTKTEKNTEEIETFLKEDEYDAVFLSLSYDNLLKDMYNKDYRKYDGIDFRYKNENIYINDNTLLKGFTQFLKYENIDLSKKTVLLLGSSKESKVVYKAIKDLYDATVYVASITEETNYKLRAGDRKIKKVEMYNLSYCDYIINTTELGNINSLNSTMLDSKNEIEASNVIDLISNPHKTLLLRQYEIKGANIYSGLRILVYQVLYALSVIYKNEEYMKRVDEIYNKLIELKEVK